MNTLDGVDAQILVARDESPDASVIETSERLGLSRNTVQARLKKLRRGDALGPPSASVAPRAVGRPLLAFVTLSVSQQQIEAVYRALGAIPEVVEAHTTTGAGDLLLRVVARDPADLHRVTQSIQSAPGVHRSNTQIATTEVIPRRMAPLLREVAGSPRGR